MADTPRLPRLIIESLDNGYVISVWEHQAYASPTGGVMLGGLVPPPPPIPFPEKQYVARSFRDLIRVIRQATTDVRMGTGVHGQ